jgi:alkaline phosphatase
MARVTLARLENERGFFALIEAANIDTHAHDADPCGQIGETIELDRAVRLVLDYQREHPNTLVVVSADHGHAGQIVPVDAETSAPPPGRYSTLETNEGARMRVSYGTAPAGANQKHTGTQIRIAAKGPHANRVLGLTDQTDLFQTMRAAIGA